MSYDTSETKNGLNQAQTEKGAQPSVNEYAKAYVQTGWAVVPIPHGEKAPRLRDWTKLRLRIEDVPTYFPDGLPKNIGVLLGDASNGLVDVDLDSPQSRRLAAEFLPPTELISGRSSTPKSHWWYVVDKAPQTMQFEDSEAGAAGKAMLAELRGNGGQTVIPPSIHPSGEEITWYSLGEPAKVSADELSKAVGKLAACSLLARYWAQGNRHYLALAVAGWLWRAEWDADDILHFVSAAAVAAGDDELEDRKRAVEDTIAKLQNGVKEVSGGKKLAELVGSDVLKKLGDWLGVKSAADSLNGLDARLFIPPSLYSASIGQSPVMVPSDELLKEQRLTDLGNATRLVTLFGADIRCCPALGGWHVWDGKRWALDDSGAVRLLAYKTVKEMYAEAAKIEDSSERKAMLKFALQSESERALRAMVSLAEPFLTVKADVFDADVDLLNVNNGTVDLKTGQLRPHKREDMITKLSDVAYDPHAAAWNWSAFLNRIFAEKREMIEFVQRAVGYSLTGNANEQCMMILHGAGANGKSVFLNAIASIAADYGMNTPTSTLMAKRGGEATNDLARLRGARFVAASETEANQRLAVALIKSMTGGEEITARFLHREFFSFKPQFTLWLATNFRPIINGDDMALKRRIRMIPFEVVIPEAERDPNLSAKLRAELPGILTWAVRGAVDWRKSGLRMPDAVRQVTDAYFNEMNNFARFLSECCIEGEGESVLSSTLYAQFKAWCELANERPMSLRQFVDRMEKRGFSRKHTKNGSLWQGVGIEKYSGLQFSQTQATAEASFIC